MVEVSNPIRMEFLEEWVEDRLKNALPLTMKEMGDQLFSDLLHGYIDDPARRMQPTDDMVEDFILYLARAGASPHAVVVALFELVKREDTETGARPLSEAELQEMPVSRLLTMRVCRHPAARAVEIAGEVPKTLLALYPNLKGCDAILLSRRIGGDLVLPLTLDELAMFRQLAHPRDLVALLGDAGAPRGSSTTFQRLVTLGAVVEVAAASRVSGRAMAQRVS